MRFDAFLFRCDALVVKYICSEKHLKSVLENKNPRALTLPGSEGRQEGRGDSGMEVRGRARFDKGQRECRGECYSLRKT